MPIIHTENPEIRALPGNVTFVDLIRANKRKCKFLIAAMILLGVVVGTVIVTAIFGFALGGDVSTDELMMVGLGGFVASLAGTSLVSLWSFYGGSNSLLAISQARPIAKADDPQLYNVVEELSIAAGLPVPKVCLIDDTAMNAFATGRDPEHAAVAITRGLREQLSRDELAGVLAHEMSHIRFYDIRFSMLMATLVGLIVVMCDLFLQMARGYLWFGGGGGMGGRRSSRSRGDGEGGGGAGAIILVGVLVLALVLSLLAPTLAFMIRMAMSRQREYLADAGAVELTRYPQGLISALQKLGACREKLEIANRATSPLFIINPMRNALRGKGHEVNSSFRTHPPLQDRIARLQALIANPEERGITK